jgi:hypothetical protein
MHPEALDLRKTLLSRASLSLPAGEGTEHYVTLFDANFLPQGLCLYFSLVQHAEDFMLWVLCIDEASFETLRGLSLPRLRLLDLRRLETAELRAVRPSRSRAEYCWTLTPFAPRWVFETDPAVKRVTYLDADLFLLKSPRPIFRELDASGKAVLITDHAYAPDYDQSSMSGKYCVQFLTFERLRGEVVRHWWQERCVEWCFNREENGLFGDQKYLESFPVLFAELTHVLERKEWLQAPWNAIRFPCSDCIAFHFQGLRLIGGRQGRVLLYSGRQIPRASLRAIYLPYLALMAQLFQQRFLDHMPCQGRGVGMVRFRLTALLRLLRGRAVRGHGERVFMNLLADLPSQA